MPSEQSLLQTSGERVVYWAFNSRADSHNYCAQYEESMKSLVVSLHTISFNFRCGGKLDLTSEVGHLGFYKLAAVRSLFSKSQLLIDLEF